MPSLLSLLLTTLFALVAAPLTNCLAAQDTNTLRAYPVAPGRAAEAQRMLTELAGPDAAHANITVNDDQHELLIDGPPELHALAKQLLQQLEQLPETPAAATSPRRTEIGRAHV